MSDNGTPIEFLSSVDSKVNEQNLIEATSLIEFRSSGHTLVLGPADKALDVASRLESTGATVVSVDSTAAGVEKRLTEGGTAVFTVNDIALTGHLGAYKAIANPADDALDLAVSVYRESGSFDTVIDLQTNPCLDVTLPPFGYFHVVDEAELDSVVAQIPELVGTFDKPKYFEYNASICAHSRSNITACSSCIDSCATGAIRSDGEGVKVDPYLCQGCGSCATSCPTGAISYAFPSASDAISKTRQLIGKSQVHTLLLHTESEQPMIDAHTFKPGTLALVVEEVSAFGMDYWSAMVCAGVQRILLISDSDAEDANRRVLSSQAKLFHRLLSGLRIDTLVVQLVDSESSLSLADTDVPPSDLSELKPEHFAPQNNKRQNIRMALDTLSTQFKPVNPSEPLTPDSLFGRIKVNQSDCTLCMACVSVCPGKALLDGQDTPALRMVEANCVQCGLCEQACPESAIELEPRYLYDGIAARKIETLKEEKPFHCISCHKPFATNKMISTMMAKLDGHWMFGDDKAKRRLKMCEDCRVKDIFDSEKGGIDVHKPTGADKS